MAKLGKWKSRIWATDGNGNDILLKTMYFDGNKLIKVENHVSEEELAEQRRKNTERAKKAFEDLARQNPEAVIAVLEEQTKAKVRTGDV